MSGSEGWSGSQTEAMAALTLAEKIALKSGRNAFSTVTIERVGLASLVMTDGPTGVRSHDSQPTTAFPVATALAATWDEALVSEVAAAIAREAAALRCSVLLAPGLNIQRTPLGGRNFEYFSEDPLLSGRMAGAYVAGVQREGVAATAKHFAANNQEANRLHASSNIDQRTLREIYLRAWEVMLETCPPWAIMCAYNAINGVFAAENRWLLQDVLKDEWGFDGVVMSDWGAVHDWRASDAGLDLEMPGPARCFGRALHAAAEEGAADPVQIDESVRRILRLAARVAPRRAAAPEAAAVESSRALARRAAEAAIVLLKNDGMLPLSPAPGGGVIAVIGQPADEPAIQGLGSSQVALGPVATPLDALVARFGADRIRYAPGVNREAGPVEMPPRLVSPDLARAERGLRARYFSDVAGGGELVAECTETHFSKLGFGAEARRAGPTKDFSVIWDGYLWPDRDGDHEFALRLSAGIDVELSIDGETVIASDQEPAVELFLSAIPMQRRSGLKTLTAGRPHAIRLIASRRAGAASQLWLEVLLFALRQPEPVWDEAVALARAAQTAIVFVGSARTGETEGEDRPDIALPAGQDALVQALVAANPNLCVVINAGGPVELPWIDQVRAVMHAWLPGEEGGAALAAVISGDVNPSGRLPHTMPRRLADHPSHAHYTKERQQTYGEGLMVGYRGFDAAGVAPLFAFGHGLSYTTFALAAPAAPAVWAADAPLETKIVVANTGPRAGATVVQLYVAPLQPVAPTAPKTLAGFQKVHLEPGEQREISLFAPVRAFQYYDAAAQRWALVGQDFQLQFAFSATDIRAESPLRVHHRSLP